MNVFSSLPKLIFCSFYVCMYSSGPFWQQVNISHANLLKPYLTPFLLRLDNTGAGVIEVNPL